MVTYTNFSLVIFDFPLHARQKKNITVIIPDSQSVHVDVIITIHPFIHLFTIILQLHLILVFSNLVACIVLITFSCITYNCEQKYEKNEQSASSICYHLVQRWALSDSFPLPFFTLPHKSPFFSTWRLHQLSLLVFGLASASGLLLMLLLRV